MCKSVSGNLIKALFSLWAILIMTGLSPLDPLTIPAFAALYLLFALRGRLRDPRASSPPVRITAVLYALMATAGTYRTVFDTYTSNLFRAGSLLIALAGSSLLWEALLSVAAEKLFTLRENGLLTAADSGTSPAAGVTAALRLAGSFALDHPALVCLLCWLPCFLYEYPGIISPDGIVQIGQIRGVEPVSNHHPVAHTLVIGFFLRIGSLFTGDPTHQAAVAVAAQMLFLAWCLGLTVKRLGTSGLHPAFAGSALFFYALIPWQSVYAVYLLKDIPFAGITILLALMLTELSSGKTLSRFFFLRFSLLLFLFCIFRSNGFYAFLLCIPFLAFLYRRHKAYRGILISLAAALICALLYRGPLLHTLGIPGADTAESLHIPMQQIARVLAEEKPLTQEDRALIDALVDTTYIRELYVPDYADNIKELLRAGDQTPLREKPGTYLLLWLRLGLRYPGTYLAAYLDQTEVLYSPEKQTEMAMIDGVYPNGLGIDSRPLIGGRFVVKIKELLLKSGPLLPGFSLLWSMAFYLWLMLFFVMMTLAGKRTPAYLPVVLPCLALYLSLFLALPVADFRYVYPMAMCAPLWPALWAKKADGQPSVRSAEPPRSPAETPHTSQTSADPDSPL